MQQYRSELGDAKQNELGPIATVEQGEVKEEQKASPFKITPDPFDR